MQTVKFYTLGCKVNQYETQHMREQFIQAGFRGSGDNCPANFYVINTCTVTHRADADSFNLIRRAIRENPSAKIIVTGCLTELDADKIREINGISLIVKNKDKENILKYLNLDHSSALNGISYFKGHTRAFLKIQDGCDNRCSYCKVHIVRGRSRSRPLNEIIQEASRLIKNGFKEIVLCGICLGSYGKDLRPGLDLIDVVSALEEIQGLLRLRLSSIELLDIGDDLIEKISKSSKLCRHLHIPLQSGDNEILAKMNRRYCCEDYLNLISRIRAKIPEIAITIDVLVGFPGETDKHFQNSVNFIKKINPLKVHIFPYSQRFKTTSCLDYNKRIPDKIIKLRAAFLGLIAKSCSLSYKKQFLLQTRPVLIEERSKENPDYWQGYTDNYINTLTRSRLDLKNKLRYLKLKKIFKDFVIAQ